MMPPSFTTDEVLERLEILWRKLGDEGMYVRANTVSLAIDEIKRLTEKRQRDLAKEMARIRQMIREQNDLF